MPKPKPIPMPEIHSGSQDPDFVIVLSTRDVDKTWNEEEIAQQLWGSCLDYELAIAHPGTTKGEIMSLAKARLKTLLDRGDRYCILFHAWCVRVSLEAMTFYSKPRKFPTFGKNMRDFEAWWKAHPKQHNALLVGEAL